MSKVDSVGFVMVAVPSHQSNGGASNSQYLVVVKPSNVYYGDRPDTVAHMNGARLSIFKRALTYHGNQH